MHTMEIGKLNNRQSLVIILNENNEITQYVVCSYYDSSQKFGEQWSWGHYFTTLKSACDYITKEVSEEE